MPSTKSVSAFAHAFNGAEKKLFFVIEKKDQSLVIIIKGEDLSARRSDPITVLRPEYREKVQPLTTSRLSVHNSERSAGGMLITKTDEFADGSSDRSVCFINDGHKNLVSHLFTKIYPDLSNGKYDLDTAPDRIVNLGQSTYKDFCSVCISVFVSLRDIELPDLGFAIKYQAVLERYRITVYRCFFNLVPRVYGGTIFIGTQKDGVGAGGIPSLEFSTLHNLVYEQLNMLAASIMNRIVNDPVERDPNRLREHPIWFFPTVELLQLHRWDKDEKIV